MSEQGRRRAPGPAFAASLVGLPKDEARCRVEELGLVTRLVDWDEVQGDVLLTMELRDDRVTVQVRHGVVIAAEVG